MQQVISTIPAIFTGDKDGSFTLVLEGNALIPRHRVALLAAAGTLEGLGASEILKDAKTAIETAQRIQREAAERTAQRSKPEQRRLDNVALPYPD